MWKAIEKANQKFAQIEQIKRFGILERDLSQEEGELTPTMKVKCQAVYEKHRDRFEALYEDEQGRGRAPRAPGRQSRGAALRPRMRRTTRSPRRGEIPWVIRSPRMAFG